MAPDARLDLIELVLRDEIGLVEQDDVREGDLVLGFRCVLQPVEKPARIRDRHHRVELRGSPDIRVDEESLGDGRRVGKPGRLDDDGVELSLALHQPLDDADEIAAHGAADAAIVHLEDFLVGADHELVVDADLAELIDDDREFSPVLLGEDAVEQGGLAGAEIAGEDGDGDFVGHGVGLCLELQTGNR